jgi:hypothetical protein
MVLAVGQRSWDLLKGVGKVNLVREGRNQTLFYTPGTPVDLSRKIWSGQTGSAEK